MFCGASASEHGAVTKLAFIVLVRKHGEGD